MFEKQPNKKQTKFKKNQQQQQQYYGIIWSVISSYLHKFYRTKF